MSEEDKIYSRGKMIRLFYFKSQWMSKCDNALLQILVLLRFVTASYGHLHHLNHVATTDFFFFLFSYFTWVFIQVLSPVLP